MIKLTARQVEVLRKMANGEVLFVLDEVRHEFAGGGRVGSNVLKPLFDAALIYFDHQTQTVLLSMEGRRAAQYGLSYEGPYETPLNVQEYAKLKVRVRRYMRQEGYAHLRSAQWDDDPDEAEIIEWHRKGDELLIVNFRPTPPCGMCELYTAVLQHNGETGTILTKVEV